VQVSVVFAVDLFGLDGTDQLADEWIEGAMRARPALRGPIDAAKQGGVTAW
jgi:hypothetical protein